MQFRLQFSTHKNLYNSIEFPFAFEGGVEEATFIGLMGIGDEGMRREEYFRFIEGLTRRSGAAASFGSDAEGLSFLDGLIERKELRTFA